ncbi:GTP cyclohydrolase I FolE [bacterium]|nr:GTP cyclohydrolase I FolE [bacterium]
MDCCSPSGPGPRHDELVEIGRRLLEATNEDPEREGLRHTPERFARSWEFLTSGCDQDIPSIINNAIFEEAYDEIVAVKNINFFSLCEHHLLPFYGTCSVAYIPKGRVIGLSKIPRIVDAYSRRLQIQERMTRQIAQCLTEHLNPLGVAVVMEARHLCMAMRGVEKHSAMCTTSELTGIFKRSAKSRSEVMTLFGMNLGL